MHAVRVPDYVLNVCTTLDAAGFEAYLVGGALRNAELGRPVGDYDLATSARPDEVKKLFRRVIPTGEQHGTVTVLMKEHAIEVTTFRSEGDYSDSRHPDHVSFERDITADLGRRDFTMNAIAMRLPQRWVVDPFEGRKDIRAGIVRAIGTASERFREDSLRVLRAIRFAAQLGFDIEATTKSAMRGHDLSHLSAERVRDEFTKMVSSTHPGKALYLLLDLELLSPWFTELRLTVGESGGGPRGDLFDHLVAACNLVPPDDIVLRLAALLHDIGKPPTLNAGPGAQFPEHDRVSAEMAQVMLERLRFPKRLTQDVVHLIRHHMFSYEPSFSDAAVRRLLRRVDVQYLDQLIRLRRIDIASKRGSTHSDPVMDDLVRRAQVILEGQDALSVKDLAVNGRDLAEAGIPKGPEMGTVLAELLEAVTDDPDLNTRARLLEIARRFYTTRLRPEE